MEKPIGYYYNRRSCLLFTAYRITCDRAFSRKNKMSIRLYPMKAGCSNWEKVSKEFYIKNGGKNV